MMGLLDGLVSNALGGLLGGGGAGGAQNNSPILQALLQLMMQNGGVSGILDRLRQGGLGQHVDSWVSTGDNLPVSGQQVGEALGPDLLGQLASKLGVDPATASHSLAQTLPDIVNRLTPEGRVPDNHQDLIRDGLQQLLGR
jgi:uncharacterized protein YidB (DUF937 family)